MKFVAVTACPTGIAHTYMAAEALEEAARSAGHDILVETQGAAGATPLTPEQIAEADAVIFAVDVEVRDRDRFSGKPLVEAPVKKAISGSAELVGSAETAARQAPAAPAGAAAPAPAPAPAAGHQGGAAAVHAGTKLRQWLMTGVSYMVPFVAAGGILIALAFMFGGAEVASKVNGGTFQGHTYPGVTDLSKLIAQAGYAGVLFKIGATAFSMLVPILAGYIAYAMADRQGLVPGVVSGLLASAIGAGFLGGLVGGLLSGGLVMLLKRVKVHRTVAGVMPVVVIPLVSSLVMGFLMLIVIGQPIAAAQKGLTDWLGSLSGANAILLGGLLGLMMAFDMGGPVNKVAYTFAVGSLASGDLKVMAAVMAAGMTPPLALALATVLRPKLFSESERKAGEAAWLLGASFITEGAIPFAAGDPLRVIPSLMTGSAVTGALAMAFGATSRAPHGGIWVIALIGKPLFYLLAIAVGTAVSAFCVIGLKGLGKGRAAAEPEEEPKAAAPAAAGVTAGAR